MSSVALEGALYVRTQMMLSGLFQFEFRDYKLSSSKPVLQKGGLEFKKQRYLPDRDSRMSHSRHIGVIVVSDL